MASTVKSNPTSTPTAKNPNFGDNDADNQARTYVLEARLPIFPSDDAFIPSIAVSVYDQHFGSKFFTSILAQGSIDLLPYISYYRIHYFARCILERKPQKGYHRDMKYDRGSNKRSWVSCQDDDDLGKVLKNDPFRLPERDIRIACAAGVTTLAEAAGQDGLLVLEEAFRFQHTSSRRQRGTNPFMEDEASKFATRQDEMQDSQRSVELALFPEIQESQIEQRDRRRRKDDKSQAIPQQLQMRDLLFEHKENKKLSNPDCACLSRLEIHGELESFESPYFESFPLSRGFANLKGVESLFLSGTWPSWSDQGAH